MRKPAGKIIAEPIVKRLIGAALWGLGMGVHESIVPAAVTPMVPPQHRASAYGLFTAGYGLFWFIGSALIGILYDRSITAAVTFCVAIEFAAVPILLVVRRHYAPLRRTGKSART